MTDTLVRVRELAGWGLDEHEFRPKAVDNTKLTHGVQLAANRSPFKQVNAFLVQETAQLHEALLPHTTRTDLLDEMAGLSWSLGVVDMRPLIAFQRRLSFHPELPQIAAPHARDWPALLALSFGSTKPVECEVIHDSSTHPLVLRSKNPNLQFRITDAAAFPLNIHTGSPFFEVACLRGRWFLRDGYHRAYALLKAGVFEVPAVIVRAKTIEELGATRPWFFPEEVLFSKAPPRLLDFLNDDLVLEYDRPPLIKTLRITIEEAFTLATSIGEQS
jgi:hypothetical protein